MATLPDLSTFLGSEYHNRSSSSQYHYGDYHYGDYGFDCRLPAFAGWNQSDCGDVSTHVLVLLIFAAGTGVILLAAGIRRPVPPSVHPPEPEQNWWGEPVHPVGMPIVLWPRGDSRVCQFGMVRIWPGWIRTGSVMPLASAIRWYWLPSP